MYVKHNLLLITMIFSLFFYQQTALEMQQTESKVIRCDSKNICDKNWTFQSLKHCGIIDRNLYISNGTFESIQFYSSKKFSLFLQQQSETFSFTGFAIGQQINLTDKKKTRSNYSKIYNIKIPPRQVQSQQNKFPHPLLANEEEKQHFANLSIYGICKTVAVSTIFKELQIKVKFFENYQTPFDHDSKKQQDQDSDQLSESDQLQQPSQLNTNTLIIKIPTTVYCIEPKTIKQANFFVTKLYYTLLVLIFGLLLNFRPLRHIPNILRLTTLVGYVWISFYIKSCYEALVSTYGLIFLLVLYYRMFQLRENYSLSYVRQLMLSKSFAIASLGSAIPLAVKSHLDDQSIEQKRILLHLVNIVMLCNILLFVGSMINLTRFRHAFYYFVAFAIAQHYLWSQFQGLLGFNVLQIQMFSSQFECDSLFFTFLLIPLCDFFFKSYSSQNMFKFFIMFIPIIAKPIYISCSLSFGVGILIWGLNEAIKGRDLIKVIRFKR